MFKLYAEKNKLILQERESITSGSVNAYRVQFGFSDDWEGLDRTAVFRCGGEARSVLLDDTNECTIPWEVLKAPGARLEAGVYGTKGGEIILPTAWASLGIILTGVEAPESDAPPTPDIWEQRLEAKQDKLTGQPGQVVGFDENGNAVAQDDGGGGEPVPGPQGPPGPVGPQGPQGPKGDPGDTPYIGENGNWWIGDTDTSVSAAGSGEGGTSDHRLLTGRDAADQHPIEAIAGLKEALARIPLPMTADELRKILMN